MQTSCFCAVFKPALDIKGLHYTAVNCTIGLKNSLLWGKWSSKEIAKWLCFACQTAGFIFSTARGSVSAQPSFHVSARVTGAMSAQARRIPDDFKILHIHTHPSQCAREIKVQWEIYTLYSCKYLF